MKVAVVKQCAWTVDTMRHYFHAMINANDVRYEQRFRQLALAATVARAEYEKWITEILKERDSKYDQRHQAVQENLTQSAATVHLLITAHEKQDIAEHSSQSLLLTRSMEAIRESLRSQIEATERAIGKAEVATEKRFDGVNEFRSTLSDQQRMLMPRSEVEVMMRSLTEKIESQNNSMQEQNQRVATLAALMTGKQEGQHSGWGWAVAVISLVLSVASLFSIFSMHTIK